MTTPEPEPAASKPRMNWFNRHLLIEILANVLFVAGLRMNGLLERVQWCFRGIHIDGSVAINIVAFCLGVLGIALPRTPGTSKVGAALLFLLLLLLLIFAPPAILPVIEQR